MRLAPRWPGHCLSGRPPSPAEAEASCSRKAPGVRAARDGGPQSRGSKRRWSIGRPRGVLCDGLLLGRRGCLRGDRRRARHRRRFYWRPGAHFLHFVSKFPSITFCVFLCNKMHKIDRRSCGFSMTRAWSATQRNHTANLPWLVACGSILRECMWCQATACLERGPRGWQKMGKEVLFVRGVCYGRAGTGGAGWVRWLAHKQSSGV